MGGSKTTSSSKIKPTTPPAPANTATMTGGQLTSRTYQDPTYGTVTSYYPTEQQSQLSNNIYGQLGNVVPQLGQTSEQAQKNYQGVADAYTQNALTQFHNSWDPMQRNQMEDYASRFGTLKATPYIDAYRQSQQQVAVPALQGIINNAIQMVPNLINQQQQQQNATANTLGGLLGGYNTNEMGQINAQQQSNQAANTFDLNKYMEQMNAYNGNMNAVANQATAQAAQLKATQPNIALTNT